MAADEAALTSHFTIREKCAINIFGLPRAFRSLVLPSLIQNVLSANKDHYCDYFVHYYNATNESAGRSGRGGGIDASEVLLLEQAVHGVHSDMDCSPLVQFAYDTDTSLNTKRSGILRDLKTRRVAGQGLLYIPASFSIMTTANIIKMWHSIESVWDRMQQQPSRFTRISMMRIYVFFATPVNVWHTKDQERDVNNTVATVPAVGLYPVSDRMIYGPFCAVQVWARLQTWTAYTAKSTYIALSSPLFGKQGHPFSNTKHCASFASERTKVYGSATAAK